MRLKAYEKMVTKSMSKAKYRHSSKCKAEVLNTVKFYRGLSPQFEKFVFDNGEVADLLNLNGTIPVEYKGQTYNIPVCIWLLAEYPYTAPMGFVVPTKDMQLKVSHYVDHTGKIFMAYLSSWSYPDSTLLGLIQACRDAFGELPPVFSKVSSQQSTSQQPLQPRQPRGRRVNLKRVLVVMLCALAAVAAYEKIALLSFYYGSVSLTLQNFLGCRTQKLRAAFFENSRTMTWQCICF